MRVTLKHPYPLCTTNEKRRSTTVWKFNRVVIFKLWKSSCARTNIHPTIELRNEIDGETSRGGQSCGRGSVLRVSRLPWNSEKIGFFHCYFVSTLYRLAEQWAPMIEHWKKCNYHIGGNRLSYNQGRLFSRVKPSKPYLVFI